MGDITFRAIETLKECDYILCEDTRRSGILVKHHQIKKPLKSFHKFNEKAREDGVIKDLQQGKTIALISDAGTPGISDPGERLIQRCALENIPYTAIPGACSIIQALVSSGLATIPFQFIGFLPKKKGGLTTKLQTLLEYQGTNICFETTHRIHKVLAILQELAPDKTIVIARELTKKFEEILRGTPEFLLAHNQKKPLKGELVILFAGIELKKNKNK